MLEHHIFLLFVFILMNDHSEKIKLLYVNIYYYLASPPPRLFKSIVVHLRNYKVIILIILETDSNETVLST